jgi:hypothetical protein
MRDPRSRTPPPRRDIDDPVAREELLRLGERTVGHLGLALVVRAHDASGGGRREALRVDELPGLLQVAVELVHVIHVRLDRLGRPAHHVPVAGAAGGVHHQHELHRCSPLLLRRSRRRVLDMAMSIFLTA